MQSIMITSTMPLTVALLILSCGVLRLEASHDVYPDIEVLSSNIITDTNQPYRTAYHFQPPKNWMNDPNGPMIYKGVYHLFYQFNPKGAVWGNIVWAHSVSKDLVNWEHLSPAIYPTQTSDINGCWSGSATIMPDGSPVIMYTGIDPRQYQVQNLARPKNLSDPFLKEWVKSRRNPMMEPTVSTKINASAFRDPTTAWLGSDGEWRVIMGSRRFEMGVAILYRSRDFRNWVEAKHPIDSDRTSGMWECPDFYPVSIDGAKDAVATSVNDKQVKHVLKISLDELKHDFYYIGYYNITSDRFIPEKDIDDGRLILRYDYGKYYASKTFYDAPNNRRILWGWLNESSSVNSSINRGWAGIQAIPRTVWLDKSGKQLVQWPVPEIEKLRTNPIKWANKMLKGNSMQEVSDITAAQADVEVSFEVSDLEKAEPFDPSWTNAQFICSKQGASVKGGLGPFGLLVLASKELQEYTAVYFRIFKSQNNYVVVMCSDQSRSSLDDSNDKTTYGIFLDVDPVHEKLSLRSLIDHSVVESFGGEGKACMTARVYPTLAINDEARLLAFNNGTGNVKITNLSAWSMNKAQIN